MTFASKIDPWLVVLVAMPALVLLLTAVSHALGRGLSHPAVWVNAGLLLVYGGVLRGFAFPVSYELSASYLLIRSGLFLRYRIPLAAIEAVQPTRSLLSAPAWSLDRLRIAYRQGQGLAFALLSPDDKAAFLRALVQRAPGLELRGETAVRR
ncbi:MAG: hypothetical protein KatS3mg131_0331 [Candidatus Tectimicrobiota bacterium]|nr:MAG: hypothetical protein KatS3mg131_0331 [Candidatus Tectomicrobia bacterium]